MAAVTNSVLNCIKFRTDFYSPKQSPPPKLNLLLLESKFCGKLNISQSTVIYVLFDFYISDSK